LSQNKQMILMGNEALARGILENNVSMATSYPGTPASEILGAVLSMAKAENHAIHAEWSINEKVAYETALAHAYCGGRAAVSMKQVGLNVAADPFLSSAYIGVKGGFVVIAADDPGPHSSQTEQDSRLLAMLAKVPVFDPSSPREAKDMVAHALALSEEFEIPVMIRPTTRICHARQNVIMEPLSPVELNPVFERNPLRWAATPKFRFKLHQELNQKLANIADSPLAKPKRLTEGDIRPMAVLASGVVLAHALESLKDDPKLSEKIDLYQLALTYPLNPETIAAELNKYSTVLVLEETEPVIEMQLAGKLEANLIGRRTAFWPDAGEMAPDVVYGGLRKLVGLEPPAQAAPSAPGRRPTLCAGCAHRAAFYALKEAMPDGIYPSDIGCYTLGMNLGAVDTVLCMGAGVSMAAGFDYTFREHGEKPRPIGATVGDSTFFHAALPALVNAVAHGASFLLVVLDNGTTAMTGHQPTPALERYEKSGRGKPVIIEKAAEGCGVEFIRVGDPYEYESFLATLREAAAYIEANQAPAVVVARRPCLMDRTQERIEKTAQFQVTEDCTSCGICQDDFGCPALVPGEDEQMVILDHMCVGCGVCVHICPAQAIEEV
jgi:indolepyruvate ferredoxin oxidoreductase alpha subunit